jgi:AraC family transcriptional regulator
MLETIQPIVLRRSTPFTAATARYAPGYTFRPHAHDTATLSMVFDGSNEHRIGTRAYVSEPLTVVYNPAGVTHTNTMGKHGLRSLFVEIAPSLIDELSTKSRTALSRVRYVRTERIRFLTGRVGAELARPGLSCLILEGLLLELVGALSGQPEESRKPPWLRRAEEYLRSAFTQNIGLSDVATIAGVHPAHLAHTFRREYQCSVGDFIRRLRLEHACSALATSNGSIGAIAMAAGFSDHSHFVRTFRGAYGVTPSQYRTSLRG